jgi:hypothetical protein
MNLFNERGCFGGSKMSTTPTPAPDPAPTPTPTQVNPTGSMDERRKKLAKMRFGLASTIKTRPELANPLEEGKSKLGQ